MPRRYADFPDAFAGWNYMSSIGSYISAFSVLVIFLVTTRGASPMRSTLPVQAQG
jgi:cytochrome c oxidase subunit 1